MFLFISSLAGETSRQQGCCHMWRWKQSWTSGFLRSWSCYQLQKWTSQRCMFLHSVSVCPTSIRSSAIFKASNHVVLTAYTSVTFHVSYRMQNILCACLNYTHVVETISYLDLWYSELHFETSSNCKPLKLMPRFVFFDVFINLKCMNSGSEERVSKRCRYHIWICRWGDVWLVLECTCSPWASHCNWYDLPGNFGSPWDPCLLAYILWVATSEGEYVKLSRAPPFRVSRNTEAWDLVSMILALFYYLVEE